MELIEDDSGVVSESEVRTGPNPTVIRALAALVLVGAALALIVTLFRPSVDPTASPRTTDQTVDDAQVEPGGATAPSTTIVDGARSAAAQTFVLPDRLEIPGQLPVPPPGQKELTLVGQNLAGQVVAFELSSRSVFEIDPASGQRFKARVASNHRVAGFRVFLGETVSLGADGSVRSMPVTEMDLPVVFATSDGAGFIVVETTTNALWLVNDDESTLSLPPLPDDLVVVDAVDDGLIVRTLDGVARRYELSTGQVGARLVGTPLAIGRDRYVTLECDGGACRTSVRALAPIDGAESPIAADDVIADLAADVTLSADAVVSPSGLRLATADGGRVRIVDLTTGNELAALDEAGNAAFVWAPDDTLFYWVPPGQFSTDAVAQEVHVFDTDGQRSVIGLPSSVLDLNQPLNVVRSAEPVETS